MNRCCYIFLFSLLLQTAAKANVIVAIWDQNVEQNYDEEKNKEAFSVTNYILPIAQSINNKWSEPTGTIDTNSWTVSFDGKNLGLCQSKNYDAQPFGAFLNVQQPIGKMPHPDKPKKLSDQQLKEYRPLVLVSAANFEDPDGWKPSKLKPQEEKLFKAAFHKKFPKADNCIKFEKDQRPHPEPYIEADIKIGKVYGAKTGGFVVEASLKKWNCDPIFDAPFDSHWFGMTTDSKVKYLSSRLALIDAGDYDRSGRSKLVFEDASDGGRRATRPWSKVIVRPSALFFPQIHLV